MAFVKRTWLARIGAGLNKFIIGNKDGEGKQTLTNAPDSVTQIGDVISAENLNDLEERIDEAFADVDTDITDLKGMKLTKVWENQNPTSSTFEPQAVTINEEIDEFLIYYRIASSSVNNGAEYFHGKCWDTSKDMVFSIGRTGCTILAPVSQSMIISRTRMVTVTVSSGNTVFTFNECWMCQINNSGTFTSSVQNGYIVPLAIYKVGDIYNTEA